MTRSDIAEMPVGSEKPVLPSEGGGDGAVSESAAGEGAGGAAFLALVKEVGRHLSCFHPPDGFQPKEALPPADLAPEMIRDLGAVSLQDFYAQALSPQSPEEAAPADDNLALFFPRGPESIRPALVAVEKEIARLVEASRDFKKSWPDKRPGIEEAGRSLENRLARFRASRTGLIQAARLWPRLRVETEAWPGVVKGLWQKTSRLEEVVTPLVKMVRERAGNGEGAPPRTLAQTACDLKAELLSARRTSEERGEWTVALETLLADLDRLLARVVKSSSPDSKDWGRAGLKLSERLTALELRERRLAEESMRGVLTLSRSLAALAELEKDFVVQDGEFREKVELSSQAVAVLKRAVDRRWREFALLYFSLRSHLGRPDYLEKMFLGLGLGLGRTQAHLDDLARRLSLAGDRLPDLQKLRSEAENLMARLGPPLPRTSDLQTIRRRLSSLLKAADQRQSFSEIKEQLDKIRRSGRETGRELNRGLLENRRMRKELESVNSALKIANQEKSRLEDQLTAARQGLESVSQIRPKLLKAFTDKAEFLLSAERDRWTRRLTRHRIIIRRQAAMRQILRSELSEAGLKIKALEAERQFVGSQLSETRSRGRVVEQINAELKTRFAALEGEKNALAEKTAFLEGDRAALINQLSTLTAEKEGINRRVTELDEARSELEGRLVTLSREKGVLAEERDELTGRVAELTGERDRLASEAADLTGERDQAAGRLTELEALTTGELVPCIQTLAKTLWRNQAHLTRSRAAARRLLESARMESEARDTSLRLAAAAREVELAESARERNRLEELAAAREGELDAARESLVNGLEVQDRLAREGESLMRRAQELEESAAEWAQTNQNLRQTADHQLGRAKKLRRALDALKRRSGRRLEAARQTEDGLRALVERQQAEMAAFHLAPVPAEGPAADQTASEGSPQPAAEEALAARLAELQPLMAFLARSFVSGVAESAQARRERDLLAEELERLRSAGPSPEMEPAGLEGRAEDADSAAGPVQERDQLQSLIAEKDEEITTLKIGLAQADRDLAENDGRLEAAWAALNYLGTRAGDTLGNMKSKMEMQVRQVDSLTLELKRREGQVKTLEDRQDKLALLYWALIATASRETAGPAPGAVPGPVAFTSPQFPDQTVDRREVLTRPVSAKYK